MIEKIEVNLHLLYPVKMDRMVLPVHPVKMVLPLVLVLLVQPLIIPPVNLVLL